jgi:hypothetical protein
VHTPHKLAGTGKQAHMQLEREREQPYAITPFWVFTLALFLSLCTKWLAKPDHFATFHTTVLCILLPILYSCADNQNFFIKTHWFFMKVCGSALRSYSS